MITDNNKTGFEPVLNLLTKFMGFMLSGSVRINIDDRNALELKRSPEENLDFSLDIREDVDKISPLSGESILDELSTAKELAQSLAYENLTISVSRNGKIAMIMGKNANPTISKLITRTGFIEIKNIIRTTQLSDDLSG